MADNGVHDAKRLRELQALPLERKIQITQTRIIEWYLRYEGKVYISFSGGKDSTVLLDLARRAFPDIPAIYVNTGLEYPEIRKFALEQKNVTEIRPRWGRAGKWHGKKKDDIVLFKQVIETHGYPVISKEVSDCIEKGRKGSTTRRAKLHGKALDKNGNISAYNCEKYLPMYYLPVKIGASCCDYMKKFPTLRYETQTGTHPLLGMLAEESRKRTSAWIKTGCNAFSAKRPESNPMAFWTEQDVLRYIKNYNITICSVYGDVVSDDTNGFEYFQSFDPKAQLYCTGCQRTGCIFCAYGCHLEKGETRFRRLAKTHPRQYEYCIGGGQWIRNPDYNPAENNPEIWNPPEIWVPSRQGLGMGKVFDMMNEIYGPDFIRYT